ncbi:RNA polymerase sigma factor [Botrimarina colliarenosi]|uniref:RNA polymerase sigma factor n=1 Tax=Botrimarina colliarenosi TaxID=2528001 RepID=A0A5C6A7R7_9BACT|nr:ECF-type sigma factor [Botrimarina colliarenosi]TWT95430.1 RNA polymerase sigma factor [Botrimarina colliarenosi]
MITSSLNAVQTKSDRSLLRRFRSGEQDAATEIYVRYARRLQALASKQTGADLGSRFDPEDVVQSVFRTFFRRASAGFYEVPDGEELWRLLLVLSLHKVRDLAVFHRAQKRDVARTRSADSEIAHAGITTDEDRLAYDSLRLIIADLINDLPESNRRIIDLRIEGHAVSDIATRSGRSKRTVERTLKSFRERLRALVESEDD